ncbi:hypothetical protein TSUD_08170 [Trifolium subterraneum]|nr:hypothetical protein TSUD_08170 [Trifolium subterraneum]
MKFQYVVLLLIVLLASTPVRNQAIQGDWTPIKNIDDPHVIEIANYAVTEHDRQTGLKLKLEKVISGETKIFPEGTKICLNITASEDSASNKYNIAVLENPVNHFRNLTSFVPLNN